MQVNGRLPASFDPTEVGSPGRAAAVSPRQRKQYNSPIGLYSEETLKEMTAMQAGQPVGYVVTKRSNRKVLRQAEEEDWFSEAADVASPKPSIYGKNFV